MDATPTRNPQQLEPMALLHTLSPELIEQIALSLRAHDISSLALSCTRMRNIVRGSLLLQYARRTELAGVYDPLYDLARSRWSIADRMASLGRWEAAWHDLGRCLSAATLPKLVVPAERDLFGPFFLRDDYLFAVDWQGHPTGQRQRQPALLYVDLREALRTGQHCWRKIDYPKDSIAITQAFSIEEDDLVVSALSLPPVDGMASKTILRFMSLETGGAHPLATEPDIQLDTELPVSLLDVRADIIGDHIVVVLVDLRITNPECDSIYLVDWKRGRITLVHRAPNGTYEGALAVLSEDLVLFLKRGTPCLELCRVTTSPRGTTPASLRIVRTLALPIFHPDYRVHTAYMQKDGYRPRHQHNPESRQRQPQQPMRAPSPLTFHSAPEDMVVGITFLLRLRGPHPSWKKVVTTISHRALFALADTGTGSSMSWDGGGDRNGEGGQGQDQESGVGGVDEAEPIPWEEWGPRATRVICPSTFHWITAHAGQRWLSLENNKLTIRDFSAARVLRARARAQANTGHTGAVAGHTAGSPAHLRYDDPDHNARRTEKAMLGPAQTRIHGHGRRNQVQFQLQVQVQSQVQGQGQGGLGWTSATCFAEDVVSELPFVETKVDVRGRAGDMVLTDGERLISFVRMGPPLTFEIYVLVDEGGSDEQGAGARLGAGTRARARASGA